MLFAQSLQKIMEDGHEIGETVGKKYEENENMPIEEMAKEISKYVCKKLKEKFGDDEHEKT